MRPFPALALIAALTAEAQVQSLDPITVTAMRTPEPRSQVPFSLGVVPPEAFNLSSSLTADDALRGSADFSLFRRNDSMTANPTTQGVSLRGLGPSGTSRSLVLLDGIPLNDPFGGWVAWSVAPVDWLAGAEIVPGGGASAWGNAALAGVIQLFSTQLQAGSGDAVARGGEFGTAGAEVSQAFAAGPGTLEVRGLAFKTEGTVLVAPQNRGPVDVDAASRHNLVSARWRGALLRGVDAVVAFRRFEEWRDNGTAYQQNRLRQFLGSVALSGRMTPVETWSLTAYLQGQDSSQTFSSVNATRTSETPASNQFEVPATAVGLAGSTTLSESSGASTTFGGDFRGVRGETREDFLYLKGSYTEQRFAGGSQAFAGVFAERSQPLGRGVHATAGIRLDRWEQSDGHLRTTAAPAGALLLESHYPNRSGTELSPSAGVTWEAADGLRLHVAGQRAFRQPTLNELYRPFRQGNTTTLANAGLSTEHADTGEVGAIWVRGAATLSVAGFAARLEDAVANVTLAQGPGTFPLFGFLPAGSSGQERLNLDRVDTRGLQVGAQWAPGQTLQLDASAVWERARVGAARVSPALVGKSLPEVPAWNASIGLRWHPLRPLFLAVRGRYSSCQFDDDQNRLPLGSYAVLDASARFVLSSHAEVFASAGNLGSSRIETAHSALGVYNLAPQRMARAGVRLGW